MPSRRIRVAIVGGGGGLSAANAMLRRGIDVTVWEQADPLADVCTGLSLFPNGWRQLERMGLGEALAKVGAKVGEGSAYYRMDGLFVSRVVIADSSGSNGIYGIHRADLLRVLVGGLPSNAVRSGRRCVTMLPHRGQGANQAIEDDVALAVFLAERDSAEIVNVLRQYEVFRRKRTDVIQAEARKQGLRLDSRSGSLQDRDREIVRYAEFRKWLYDYDVESDAVAYLNDRCTSMSA